MVTIISHVSAGDGPPLSEKCCFCDVLCTLRYVHRRSVTSESCMSVKLGVRDEVMTWATASLAVIDAQN